MAERLRREAAAFVAARKLGRGRGKLGRGPGTLGRGTTQPSRAPRQPSHPPPAATAPVSPLSPPQSMSALTGDVGACVLLAVRVSPALQHVIGCVSSVRSGGQDALWATCLCLLERLVPSPPGLSFLLANVSMGMQFPVLLWSAAPAASCWPLLLPTRAGSPAATPRPCTFRPEACVLHREPAPWRPLRSGC